MRILRVIIGGMIVVIALFVIVGEQLTGASENAVVNARLTTLKSPIAGEVDIADRPLGAALAEGDTLGRVTNPLVETVRLNDLILQRDVEEAHVARLAAQLGATRHALGALRQRAGQYGSERVKQLSAARAATEARLAAARARLSADEATRRRAERLSSRGVAATATLEQATADAEVARKRVEEVDGDLSVLEIALAAARNGIFLGDGTDDAPSSEQQAKTLEMRVGELAAELAEARSRIVSLGRRIASEERRIAQERSAVLAANVDGRLWEVLAARGERIQSGQPVLRLLDCSSTIVTVTVNEAVYNRLAVGDPVRFRLNGENLVFEGSVSRLAGIGADAIYENLAVRPTGEHVRRYDVALLVPELRDHPELGCAIGRTGRAFFDDLPLDWARRTFATLAR